MTAILQTQLPQDMRTGRALPGVQPETGPWLRVDEAYDAQMQRRLDLILSSPDAVLYLEDTARPAAKELLSEVLATLPSLGFERLGDVVHCPDGRQVVLDTNAPMKTLGQLCQCDFVLMQKRADQHVLTGAVLCFPASWRLSEKAGRALTDIHVPVSEYDAELARRVQRLFDGIQVGRPVWRFNQLWYDDPELFQPRSQTDPRPVGGGTGDAPFFRTERQTLLRLPQSRAVVFVIHTLVLARDDVPALV